MRAIFDNIHTRTNTTFTTLPIQLHHLLRRHQLIRPTTQIQNRHPQTIRNNPTIPPNPQNQHLQRRQIRHKHIHHPPNTQKRILHNQSRQRYPILLRVRREVKRNGATERPPKEEQPRGVDGGVGEEESEAGFRVAFKSTFRGFRFGFGVAVAAVFDHEDVGVEEVVHLVGVGEAEADVSRVSVEEYDGGELVLFGVGVEEEPRVDFDSVACHDHVAFEWEFVFGGTAVPSWIGAWAAWYSSNFGEVQQLVLFFIQNSQRNGQKTNGESSTFNDVRNNTTNNTIAAAY
mmetsp:Transcript_16591/g.20668  ORF Transcript_16591/g.20668 Transcript_16591/m.20668 type:complete len:288 (+) Transcript_16591:274-1137(+)